MRCRGNMKSKQSIFGNKLRFWGFMAAGVCFIAAGVSKLFWNGPLKENLWIGNGWPVILEVTLFFVWMLLFCCLPMAAHVRLGGISLGILAGIWCHQVFLPFVISGLWLLGLLMLGDTVRQALSGEFWDRLLPGRESQSRLLLGGESGDRQPSCWQQRLTAAFVLGSGAWICLICTLSAFRIGGLGRIRLTAAGIFLVLAVRYGAVFTARRRQSMPGKQKESGRQTGGRQPAGLWPELSRGEGILLAVILTMLFIQLARINQWPDYDSLHYGLRSPFVLDNGYGIYEDLGNINLVYTYPKGFEILSFPLAGTATFGYVLCFNLWLTILALILTGGLACQISLRSGQGLLASALVSLIPGVMNMAITAKSDTVTLVCQLGVLISASGIFTEERAVRRWRWVGIAVGSCFLSFAMKPTSVVFSTAVSLVCLAVLAGKGGFAGMDRQSPGAEGRFLMAAAVLSAGAWAGTWIRTYRMTGVPTTSVFTSIWERLGFQVRWPYAFAAIPDQGLEMSFADSIRFLAKRVCRILIAPTGEDMAHVIIAWGTSLTALLLIAWILWGRKALKRRKNDGERKAAGCIYAAAVFVGILSLFSIYLLWQVDGNYFMLMYVLLAVIGAGCLEEGVKEGPAGRAVRNALACGFLLFQAAVTLSTSWSGSMGFTPVRLKHHGYYDHQQALYEEKCREGNQAIWSILSQDPSARVIAVGAHPQVLLFPCNVQSYYDVTGSGGNVRLVKTLDNFKQFLRFAKTDYLYVQAGFLEEGTRCYDVVRYLVEDGSLADIRYENGNMIAAVDLDGTYSTDPEREAEEFYKNIRLKTP